MLRFFRNIRRRLLDSGSVRKYFVYAVGEILLVVIGILIALQINNWNEERKKRNWEYKITQELYDELILNLEYTNGLIDKDTKLRIEAIKTLLTLTSSENPNISFEQFNKLYSRSSGYQEFTPYDNMVRKILNLDQFEFSQSKTLYNELLLYESSLDETQGYFQYNVDTYKMANLPFILEEYPVRNFEWNPGYTGDSKHIIEPKLLIKNRKFENLLYIMLADVNGYQERLLGNIEKIKFLQKIIETDYVQILQKN